MGLLDASFSAVNGKKPRKSDKQYEGEDIAANARISAGLLADFTPVVGGIKGAYEEAKAGNPVMSAVNAATVPLDLLSGGVGGAALKAGLLGTFIGKGAKTWDAVKASEAASRLAKGDDAAKVWKETGTFKGPDGHFRQEVDDSAASISKNVAKQFNDYGARRQSAFFKNDNVVSAYPELSDGTVVRQPLGDYNGLANFDGSVHIGVPRKSVDSEKMKSIMIHENQHLIQNKEGFALGGNPEEFEDGAKTLQNYYDALTRSQYGFMDAKSAGGVHPETGLSAKTYSENMNVLSAKIDELKKSGINIDPYESYQRLAGEAEARLTQHRMNLTPDERLAQFPYDPAYFKQATGVDINDLIVRGGNGPAMSVPKLTEYEQRHLTAQKNAALPVEQGGLGLPVDNTAMDRAGAMGFEDGWLHGTRRQFNEFAPSSPRGANGNKKGVYFTKDKQVAEEYAQDVDGAFDEKSNVIGAMLRNPEVINHSYRGAEGFVENPANIRSRFAAFDPMRRHEADLLGYADPYLLGGISGASLLGLGGYGLLSDK